MWSMDKKYSLYPGSCEFGSVPVRILILNVFNLQRFRVKDHVLGGNSNPLNYYMI